MPTAAVALGRPPVAVTAAVTAVAHLRPGTLTAGAPAAVTAVAHLRPGAFAAGSASAHHRARAGAFRTAGSLPGVRSLRSVLASRRPVPAWGLAIAAVGFGPGGLSAERPAPHPEPPAGAFAAPAPHTHASAERAAGRSLRLVGRVGPGGGGQRQDHTNSQVLRHVRSPYLGVFRIARFTRVHVGRVLGPWSGWVEGIGCFRLAACPRSNHPGPPGLGPNGRSPRGNGPR